MMIAQNVKKIVLFTIPDFLIKCGIGCIWHSTFDYNGLRKVIR
jgi:hypothetical protein